MQSSIASVLILVAAAAGPAPGENAPPEISAQTARSGGQLIPDQAALQFDHADLSLQIFPDRRQIAGSATHSFTARAPLDHIVIDLDRNLAVSSIFLDGEKVPPARFSNPEGRLSITPLRPISTGHRLKVRIDYAGTPRIAKMAPYDGALVWAKTESGKPWVVTAVQGEGCDTFWPCIDHPTGEPALMDYRITVPAGLAAPANGVLQSVKALPDGRSTYHWLVKNPNTYGIAINVGPYKLMKSSYRSRFGNRIPIEFWHLEGHEGKAAGLAEEFAPTLDFLEALIGPYPFADEKMGIAETPHIGMEHQTINAYGNRFAKSPTGFDFLFHHEFSHEWFANQLTASDWDHYWLHEGYAQYMQPLYSRWRGGEFAYHAAMAAIRPHIMNNRPLVSGKPMTEQEVYLDATGPGNDIYAKGVWLLHTLRNHIGDDAFFRATRRIVYGRPDPRPGNFKPRFATSADFRQIANEETGRDIGWFFDIYLDEAALPELIEERTGDTLNLRWQAPRGKPFPMPVEVEVDGQVHRLAMAGNWGSLRVPRSAHIVLDPSGKILRRSKDIETFQAWHKAETKKAEALKAGQAKKAAAAKPQ